MEQWIRTATAICKKWKTMLQEASSSASTAEDFLTEHFEDWKVAVHETFGSKGRKHLASMSNTTMRGRMLKAMVAIVDLTKGLDTKRDQLDDATLEFLQLEAELQRITTALRKISGGTPTKTHARQEAPTAAKDAHRDDFGPDRGKPSDGHPGTAKNNAKESTEDSTQLPDEAQSDEEQGKAKDASEVVTPRPAALETLDDAEKGKRQKRARTLPPPRRRKKARTLPPPRKPKKGKKAPAEPVAAEMDTNGAEPDQDSKKKPGPPPLPMEVAQPASTTAAAPADLDQNTLDEAGIGSTHPIESAEDSKPIPADILTTNEVAPHESGADDSPAVDEGNPQNLAETDAVSSDEDGPTDELQSLSDPHIQMIEESDEDAMDVTRDHGLVDDAVALVETGENAIATAPPEEVFSEDSHEVEIQSVDLMDDHLLDEPVLPLKVKKESVKQEPTPTDAPQPAPIQSEQDQVFSRVLTSGEDARITALELYVARLRSADSLTVQQRSALDHVIAVLGMALPKDEAELARALADLNRLYSQSENTQAPDIAERRNVLDGLSDSMRTALFRASEQAEASGIDFVLSPTKRWDTADHLPVVDLARTLIDDLSPWRLPSSLLYLDGPAVSFRFSAQARKGIPLAWPMPKNRLELSVVASTDRILVIALHLVAPDTDHPLGRSATAGIPGGGVLFQVSLPAEEIASLQEGIRQFAISETGRFIRTLRRNIVR
ncbi:MAG: hypothetical protein J7M25_09545 [Deltaproteobacteria bacterium]|nr:hypothetical protein [Deltaproteobacteria bacterium]